MATKPPPPPPGKGKGAPPSPGGKKGPPPGGKGPPAGKGKGPPPSGKGSPPSPPAGKGKGKGPPSGKGTPPAPPGGKGKGPPGKGPPGSPGAGKGAKGKAGKAPPPSPGAKSRPPPPGSPSSKPASPPSKPASQAPSTPKSPHLQTMPQLPSQHSALDLEAADLLKGILAAHSQPASMPGTPRGASPEQSARLLNRMSSLRGQVDLLQQEMRDVVGQPSPQRDGRLSPQFGRGLLPVVDRIFKSCDRRVTGRVSKSEFRGALMAEADMLQDEGSLEERFSLDRLVRMLDQPGVPYDIDWEFVQQAFGNSSSPRRFLSFEDQLAHAFTAVARPNGRAQAYNVLREMRHGACNDPQWESLVSVLEAGPDMEVTFEDLLRMRHASVPRERDMLSPYGRRPFAEGFASQAMSAVARRSPSPPVPLGGALSPTSDYNPMSPSAAKRMLRAEAVAERVAALRDTPRSMRPGRDGAAARNHHQSLTTRLSGMDSRLQTFSGEEAERLAQLGDKIAMLEGMLDEEGKAVQRNARSAASRLQGIRDSLKAGSSRREMTETTAPRIYKFLMQGADGMQLTVGSEQSPVARAREDLALDTLLTELRVKSEQLDDIIHQHGLSEERLTHTMRKEVKTLTAEIEEERAKRKHMESVFVSLMESIIRRLYDELNEAFNERKAMDTRLQAKLNDAVAIIGGTVL